MHAKRTILSFLLVLSVGHSLSAQSDSRQFQHFFRTNITQFIVGDFGLEYEYIFKNGIGIAAGFSHKLGRERDVSNMNISWMNNQLHYMSAYANTFSLGPSFILKDKERFHFYITPQFFYRYMWYDHLIATENDDFDGTRKIDQSMSGYVYGTKFLLGFRWIFPASDKLAFTLDLVTGLSIRTKQLSVTQYGSARSNSQNAMVPYPVPLESEVRYTAPAPQVALKLGMAF